MSIVRTTNMKIAEAIHAAYLDDSIVSHCVERNAAAARKLNDEIDAREAAEYAAKEAAE